MNKNEIETNPEKLMTYEQGGAVEEVQVKLKLDSAEQKMKKPLMRNKMKKNWDFLGFFVSHTAVSTFSCTKHKHKHKHNHKQAFQFALI